VRFLLIRHSKYSAILLHSYRLFFGDFAHCDNEESNPVLI